MITLPRFFLVNRRSEHFEFLSTCWYTHYYTFIKTCVLYWTENKPLYNVAPTVNTKRLKWIHNFDYEWQVDTSGAKKSVKNEIDLC